MEDMIRQWKWSKEDRIMHVLPINHIHGLVNCLLTPLYCGAECLLATNTHPIKVWRRLKDTEEDPVTIIMSVPTMYNQLVRECRDLEFDREYKVDLPAGLRLVVSGSAPLTQITFDKWNQLTGHRILERYGMTETGMILTNPTEADKIIPGTVGMPFPSLSVRLVADDGSHKVLVQADGDGSIWRTDKNVPLVGAIEAKGRGITKTYLDKTHNEQTFAPDGYFRTGDIASFETNSALGISTFRLLGRQNVDILKVGGNKVSALSVERAILGHPDVGDCAVIGADDPFQWGHKIVAFIVPSNSSADLSRLTTSHIRKWASKLLPAHELPVVVHIVNDLDRNLMGKLQKKILQERHKRILECK